MSSNIFSIILKIEVEVACYDCFLFVCLFVCFKFFEAIVRKNSYSCVVSLVGSYRLPTIQPHLSGRRILMKWIPNVCGGIFGG